MTASFFNPVRLVHGAGALDGITDVLAAAGVSQPLVVTDATIADQPFFAALTGRLDDAKISHVVFDGCLIDARLSHVEAETRRLAAEGLDGVLGVGGGSVMCTAKGIATLAANGERLRPLENPANIRNRALPTVLVPTTAGSGTEVSPGTIVKDDVNGGKFTFMSPRAYARTAVLDPVVLETIPRRLSAVSAADALTHAVEATLSELSTPLTDALALGAARTLAGSVAASINDRDERAMADHLLGATVANLACGHARLGLSHRLSRPLEETFSVPHGEGVGTLLPRVVAFCGARFPDKLPGLADALGLASEGTPEMLAARIADGILDLYGRIGFPTRFDAAIVDRDRLRTVAEMAVTRTTDEGPPPERIEDDTVITAANRQRATVAEGTRLLGLCCA